jgi:hypothetical protein
MRILTLQSSRLDGATFLFVYSLLVRVFVCQARLIETDALYDLSELPLEDVILPLQLLTVKTQTKSLTFYKRNTFGRRVNNDLKDYNYCH